MSLTEQEILEGNKLIAEFLGIEKKIYGETGITYYIDNIPYQLFKLKYHSSWDWLMPVVEKIELDNSAVVINNNECMIVHYGKPDESIEKDFSKTFNSGNTKIETTWIAVVAFIKFYNNNLVQ